MVLPICQLCWFLICNPLAKNNQKIKIDWVVLSLSSVQCMVIARQRPSHSTYYCMGGCSVVHPDVRISFRGIEYITAVGAKFLPWICQSIWFFLKIFWRTGLKSRHLHSVRPVSCAAFGRQLNWKHYPHIGKPSGIISSSLDIKA